MKWTARRDVSKQLTCPRCGVILAGAVYRPWPGNLKLTAPEGYRLQPLGGAIQVRLAQEQVGSAAPAERVEAEERLAFLRRHLSELIYDLRCRNGHSTLRTAPQIVRAMRRTEGQWVQLA